MCMFIDTDKININDAKFEDIAVTSICRNEIIPKITKTAYKELNKQMITNLISLNIKNKTKIIINVTKKTKSNYIFLNKIDDIVSNQLNTT